MSKATMAANAASKGAGFLDSVTSSEFYGALKETGIGGALAGGGLGMVANAGYNYATDQHGGYVGSALLGAGAGAAGRAYWNSGGKELFHTATGKVKNQVMTATGTGPFGVREHDNLKVLTTKNGSHDLAGQQKLVKDMDAKLANMNSTHADYDKTLREREAAYNGLDHMQSVIDNKLSQSDIGARKLHSRYDNMRGQMENTQQYKDWQEHQSLDARKKALEQQRKTASQRHTKAEAALNAYKAAKGDVWSPDRQKLVTDLAAAQQLKNHVGGEIAKFNTNHGQRLTDLGKMMGSDSMQQFMKDYNTVTSKVAAANDIIKNHSQGKAKHVLNGMTSGLNTNMGSV